MAISTIGVELRWGTSAEAVAKVIEIKDFPDLYGENEMLETTTLSSPVQTHIPGVKASETLTFTYNFTKEDFAKVEADANKPLFYELVFSDGSKFTWEGQHTSGLPGKSVNEVIEATVNIAASTAVVFSAE
jgi:hypothetical protein